MLFLYVSVSTYIWTGGLAHAKRGKHMIFIFSLSNRELSFYAIDGGAPNQWALGQPEEGCVRDSAPL
jgi:hypothetical protein